MAGATRLLAVQSGLPVLALLMLACGVASMVMGADRGWDAQNYHVYAPWRLFVDRPFDLLPAGMQGFHNPLPDIPFGWLLWRLNDWPRLIAFLMGLPAGAVLWVAWRCARHMLAGAPAAEWLAVLAAVGTAGGAVFRSQVGTTSGDVVTGGLVLLGVLALLRPAVGHPWRAAALAGLACGAAIGLKLTNAPFAPAIAVMVAARLGLDRRLPAALLACALGGLAGMVATGGWWAAHLAAATGNPLFPYFNELFDTGEGIPRAGRDLQFMPATLTEALIRPFLWAVSDIPRVTEERMRDPRLAAGLLAALALPFLRGAPARRGALPVAAFLLAGYALWLPIFSIYRYAFVLEALAPALLIAALTALSARAALAAAAVAVMVAFPLTKPVPALRAPLGDLYLAVDWPALAPGATVLGTAKPTAFLAIGLPPEVPLWSLTGIAEVGGPRDRAALAALRDGAAPLYAVAPGDGQGFGLLASHGLSPVTEGCRRICTNWSPAGAGPLVCPLARDGRADSPPPLRHAGPTRRLCEAAGRGLVSAGRRGLRVDGAALLDFGAGCRVGEVLAPGAERLDATPAAEPQQGGRFRFVLPADGLVGLRGDVVLAEARCIGQ
ncbi:hypothetical protein [Roseomonas sp. CAU 1739]|uniref:hypothetical protein n=1 Tax=Roseomonas sp. CAU 1739 TaxID=3140364 RepID=UPI00325AF826